MLAATSPRSTAGGVGWLGPRATQQEGYAQGACLLQVSGGNWLNDRQLLKGVYLKGQLLQSGGQIDRAYGHAGRGLQRDRCKVQDALDPRLA